MVSFKHREFHHRFIVAPSRAESLRWEADMQVFVKWMFRLLLSESVVLLIAMLYVLWSISSMGWMEIIGMAGLGMAALVTLAWCIAAWLPERRDLGLSPPSSPRAEDNG
jgi:hypothetical protein